MRSMSSRRQFIGATAGLSAGLAVPTPVVAKDETPQSPNQRLGIGCIGLRYQGTVVAHQAARYGQIVAMCDVDRHVREQGRASFGSTPRIYEDYREMLERPEVDVVTIGAPDHWHTKMLIDACRAGKDVYCEKPLTLTVDEGKLIRKVVQETGQVVQVGSWQRSDHRFRLAVEMVRQGRIGKLRKVTVVLGKNKQGGPFEVDSPPPQLNWDLWQGQTPDVPFLHERSHYTFRWWYAYSGGQMTDWGAHHLDIAQWAIGEYPIAISSQADFPNIPNGFDVATNYHATYRYPNGVVMTVDDHGRNGILFEGSGGRIFVNRGTLSGSPVDALKDDPLPREEYQLYAHDNLDRPARMGKLDAIQNHMGNFFDCVADRRPPLSDVESQHRSVTTCHLGNISMWEGRALTWDPVAERFPDKDPANQRLWRAQRAGFELA